MELTLVNQGQRIHVLREFQVESRTMIPFGCLSADFDIPVIGEYELPFHIAQPLTEIAADPPKQFQAQAAGRVRLCLKPDATGACAHDWETAVRVLVVSDDNKRAGTAWFKLRKVATDRDMPSSDGKEAEVAARRGDAEFAEGRYLAAIDSYSHAIRLNPDDVESYINRGNAHTKSGDHDRAIADYDRAIALNESKGLDRENAIVYFNRGNARFAKGQYDQAIEDYTKAIGRNPKDANAYTNRGIAREKVRDRDGAQSDLATAAWLEAEAQPTPSP